MRIVMGRCRAALLFANCVAIFLLFDYVATQDDCFDSHQFCSFWAGIGECENNTLWMPRNCRLSCGICNLTRGDVDRCDAVRQQFPFTISQRISEENLIIIREDLKERTTMTLTTARAENANQNCAPQLKGKINCTANMCYNLMYRSFDGTCNNFDNPLWGAAFTPFIRHFPAIYDDGIGSPVSSQRVTRPSPREASRFLLSSQLVVPNNDYSSILMQWGQFLTHDISHTMQLPNFKCTSCTVIDPSCNAIPVQPTDAQSQVFGCEGTASGPHCCVRMARSTPMCGTGTFGVPREQYNENTAYIDASAVYGSSEDDSNRLRAGNTGFMRAESFNDKPFPPFGVGGCVNESTCTANFQAGDDRANLFIGLATYHTLFLREHNRIVAEFQKINPHWTGERLYQEARKLVGAEIQAITYNEYLPKILGSQYRVHIPTYAGYNRNIQATIANDFSTGAMRFGHGMVYETFTRIDHNGVSIPEGSLPFGDGVFQSKKILFEGGIDPILRGLMTTAAKQPHRITPSLTERLLGSLDLASMNIQRGRDHGLLSYNHYRGFCSQFGMFKVSNFFQLSGDISDPLVRQNMQQLYGDPDNVDLYVGMLLEDPVEGGMVGPTLSCLLGEQFLRLRDGDRLWYQNPGVFSPAQLREIEKVTFARIICDNGDNFGFAPREAFRHVDLNSFTNCNSTIIDRMDLSMWREAKPTTTEPRTTPRTPLPSNFFG